MKKVSVSEDYESSGLGIVPGAHITILVWNSAVSVHPVAAPTLFWFSVWLCLTSGCDPTISCAEEFFQMHAWHHGTSASECCVFCNTPTGSISPYTKTKCSLPPSSCPWDLLLPWETAASQPSPHLPYLYHLLIPVPFLDFFYFLNLPFPTAHAWRGDVHPLSPRAKQEWRLAAPGQGCGASLQLSDSPSSPSAHSTHRIPAATARTAAGAAHCPHPGHRPPPSPPAPPPLPPRPAARPMAPVAARPMPSPRGAPPPIGRAAVSRHMGRDQPSAVAGPAGCGHAPVVRGSGSRSPSVPAPAEREAMLSLLEVGGSLLERAAVGNPLSLLLAASAFALSLGYLFQLGYRRHVGAGRTVGAGHAGSGRCVRLPRAGRVGARPRPPVRHRAERPLRAAGSASRRLPSVRCGTLWCRSRSGKAGRRPGRVV